MSSINKKSSSTTATTTTSATGKATSSATTSASTTANVVNMLSKGANNSHQVKGSSSHAHANAAAASNVDYYDEMDMEDDDYRDDDEDDEDVVDLGEEGNDNDDSEIDETDFALISDEQINSIARNTHKKQHGLDEEFKYEVLTPDKIVQHMIECIKEVNQVVQLPATTTRILLHHFRWDKEKLMERFYDGDQEGLFREAHVVSPFKNQHHHHHQLQQQQQQQSSSSSSSSSSSKRSTTNSSSSFNNKLTSTSFYSSNSLNNKEISCNICYLTNKDENMTGLECGHKFCKYCWDEYLKTKIMDEGMGQTISCAAHNCDILVDDNTVMSLVSDSKVKVKYQHLITNSFVECNRLMRWCPSPNCSNAIKAQYFDAQPVTCTCGYTFCFGCGELWHDPVKCKWLKKWIKKCDDDSETSNWIAANTKECPKCHVTIEKNGGCNHMICKNQACRSEFCWVCMGAWEPHGSSWYNCNRYNEDDAKRARDAQERSRAALQRYLHYCNRYMNHLQSLKFEHKLYATVRDKMEEMQQHNMSWIEVQFLKKAVDVLHQCRQTLMYTYAFAFYLKKNNHSMIFEDNQADLEMATEKLSGYLERDISDNVVDIKQSVQDKYRYCEQRRKVLLDHVHEGYDKDYWEYQEDL